MSNIKLSMLNGCKEGENVSLDVVIKELKEVDTTGRSYNQTMVVVEDRTGELRFPIWKTKDNVEQDMKVGMMYTLYGVVSEYNQNKQIKYTSSKIIADTPENRKEIDVDFSKGITEENKKALPSVIATKFESERYKRYAEIALGLGEVPEGVEESIYRERLERFEKAWCSIRHHDNYDGGLWNHVVGMIRVLLVVKKIYSNPIGRQEDKSNVNWDHLLLLCILHDIEKPSEHIRDEETGKCYHNTEIHTDHIINGVSRVDLINREVERENQLTFTELENLKYGILCHHGQWGNHEFKSSEDKIFHAIDLIDSANVDELTFD